VDVRVTVEVAVSALDDGNCAALAAWNASIRQTFAIVGRHGVDEDAQAWLSRLRSKASGNLSGNGTVTTNHFVA